jgi:hypothetical protein
VVRRVYALGATGILNALDAADGTLVWSRDAMADTGMKLPMWGFAGSPLVIGDEPTVSPKSAGSAPREDGGDRRRRLRPARRLRPRHRRAALVRRGRRRVLHVYQGHAFGFDGRILARIDLDGSERRWKGGLYGNGQLVLLEDQVLLLVLGERRAGAHRGEPDRFTELSRFPAIEGKTWNHLSLVGDLLLARNSEEIAAFRRRRTRHRTAELVSCRIDRRAG